MTAKTPELFDESKINDFLDCPRKGYFNWRLKIKPVAKNFNLDFGTIYHDTLAFFFNRVLGTGGVIDNILQSKLDEWAEIAIEEFVSFYSDQELVGNDNKNLDVGVKILRKYFARKGYDYGTILDVEATLYDRELKHASKVDLIAEKDGVIKIIDHKTTAKLDKSVLTDSTNNKWKQRRAFIGYRNDVELKYPGADRYETIVHIIHCIKGNGRDTFPDFYHVPFTIPQFRLDEWREFTQHFVNVIKMWDGLGVYPKTGQPCNDYNWPCSFLSLCNTNKTLGDMVIGGDFEKKEEWYV